MNISWNRARTNSLQNVILLVLLCPRSSVHTPCPAVLRAPQRRWLEVSPFGASLNIKVDPSLNSIFCLTTEEQNRLAFIDFLQGLLNLNHFERWSPQQAKQHPFITGEPFLGPFVPSMIPKSNPTTPRTSSNDTSPLGSSSFQSPILPVSSSSQNQPSYENSPTQDRSGQRYLNLSHSPSRHSYMQSSPPDDSRSLPSGPPKPAYMPNTASALPPPVGAADHNTTQPPYTHTNSGLGITLLYPNSLGQGYQEISNKHAYSATSERSAPSATEHKVSQPNNSHTYYDLGSVVVTDESARDIPPARGNADEGRGWSNSMPGSTTQPRWNDGADLERNDAAEDYGPGVSRTGGSLSAGTISNVASFHRRVRRPHNQQYQRQDLEWDGSGGLSPDEPYGTRTFRRSSYQDQSDKSRTMA